MIFTTSGIYKTDLKLTTNQVVNYFFYLIVYSLSIYFIFSFFFLFITFLYSFDNFLLGYSQSLFLFIFLFLSFFLHLVDTKASIFNQLISIISK